MRTISYRILIVSLLVGSLRSCTQDKARILIIGDSISIGYTPFVKEELERKAEVIHNPGNAEHTGTGLEKIEEWMGDGNWDIVQFNWGLWDLCYRHPDSKVQGNRDKENGKITFELDEYISNLDSIVTILKSKTNAKLVFVTTTYVPENEAGRYKEDAFKYNEAAKEIMKSNSVIVNDIYEASIPIHKEFGKGIDDVHYINQGYEKLSEMIIRVLESEMNSFAGK